MNTNILALIAILFFGTINAHAILINKDDIFDTLCLQNKEHLLAEKTKDIQSNSKLNSSYIAGYQREKDNLKKWFEKLNNGYRLTVGEKTKLLKSLQKIGRLNTYNGILYYSPVIEDNVIPKIIVSALQSNAPEVKKEAASALEYFKEEDLKKYSDQILSAMKADSRIQSWEYVYFTPKQQKEFDYLSETFRPRPDLGEIDKALFLYMNVKLGDETALKSMIQELKSTKNFRLKRYLVKYLGLIGNKKCIEALLEALNDNQQQPKGRTLRYLILPAIWRNYPDEELFVRYCPWLHLGDNYIGGEEGIKKLYEEICIWAKKEMAFDLNLNNAEPLILDPYGTVYKRYNRDAK